MNRMDYLPKSRKGRKIIEASPFYMVQLPSELIDIIVSYFDHINDFISIVVVNKRTLQEAKQHCVKKCKKHTYDKHVNVFKLYYNIVCHPDRNVLKYKIYSNHHCQYYHHNVNGLVIIDKGLFLCAFGCYHDDDSSESDDDSSESDSNGYLACVEHYNHLNWLRENS